MLELPFYAVGIKFPQRVKEGDFYSSLRELKDSQYVKSRPLVVFPEGTKSNGRGILSFESDIINVLLASIKQGLHLHTLRFDYEFTYTSPYNTINTSGLAQVIKLLT